MTTVSPNENLTQVEQFIVAFVRAKASPVWPEDVAKAALKCPHGYALSAVLCGIWHLADLGLINFTSQWNLVAT